MKLRWWSDSSRDVRGLDSHDMAASPHPLPMPSVGTSQTWTGTTGDDTHDGTNQADTLDGNDGNDIIDAKKGNDSVTGGNGNDTLTGGDGDDSIFGGNDNDVMNAGIGTDALDGGALDDIANFGAAFDAADSFAGGSGTDTLNLSGTYAGTITLTNKISGVESIVLNTGATTVVTNNNLLSGSSSIIIDASHATSINFNGAAETTGAFTVIGGNNADQITGGAGGDTISGGKGDDTIAGGLGNDTVNGEDGNDAVHVGGSGADTVNGGKGDDVIVFDGNGALNSTDGGAGIDTINASAVTSFWNIGVAANIEHWILSGLDDTFFLTNNIDETWEAGGGNDTIDASGGNDTIYGGIGDDRLYGGKGNDTLDGGDGYDLAVFSSSTRGVNANLVTHVATGDGTDTLTNIEGLLGSNNNDTLVGDDSANQFAGFNGNDDIDGGGGIDTAYYNSISSGDVVVNLKNGNVTGALGHDHLINIENVAMGGGNDTVTGDDGNNTLYGGDGNDILDGGKGNNTLVGGNGADRLITGLGAGAIYGGAGTDTFVFTAINYQTFIGHPIYDITGGETIDFSAIDAIQGNAGSSFIVVLQFNGAPGEATITYDSVNNQTIIALDTNGGEHPNADTLIFLNGDHLTSDGGTPVTTDLNIIW